MPVQDGRPRPRIVRAPISKVAFLVCSRSRIAPLSECIAGIAAQTPVTGLAVDIVVADNAETSRAEFIRSLHPGLHYVHEPARGYSNVRNAALRCALAATDADVLIFIDDDAIPQADLLGAYDRLFAQQVADVAAGGYVGQKFASRHRNNQKVATYNVAFRRWIADALQFCPQANLLGCEDHEFFSDARRLGAIIRPCSQARVRSPAIRDPDEPTAIDDILLRRASARNAIVVARDRHGLAAALASYLRYYLPRGPRGLCLAAASLATGNAALRDKAHQNLALHSGALAGVLGEGFDRELVKRGRIVTVPRQPRRVAEKLAAPSLPEARAIGDGA